jgi:hypothetical protein
MPWGISKNTCTGYPGITYRHTAAQVAKVSSDADLSTVSGDVGLDAGVGVVVRELDADGSGLVSSVEPKHRGRGGVGYLAGVQFDGVSGHEGGEEGCEDECGLHVGDWSFARVVAEVKELVVEVIDEGIV